jgi:hypothetical protein
METNHNISPKNIRNIQKFYMQVEIDGNEKSPTESQNESRFQKSPMEVIVKSKTKNAFTTGLF